jgi:molybdopterin molybdotransferase
MAQLSDDCFAFDGPLLPIEEAARRMSEHVPVIDEIEVVPLRDAVGRVTVEPIHAPIAVPPFDNSAVDGYAARHADVATNGETRLPVAARVAAGASAVPPLGARAAVRIFTGAPMPEGADLVYMQEDCRVEGDTVIVPAGLKSGSNRRLAGEDIAKGEAAISAGRRLRPADIALAAALGVDRIKVRRRVRVALFSTGDELAEPGGLLPPAAIHDSNRYFLLGLLNRIGAETSDLGILKDDPDVLAAAISGAADTHDLVLTSGGVSTGEADHVKSAVDKIGRLVFWRLAIKPGRPVAMGVIKGAAFAGLPGNPAAVFVTFIHVVRPLIQRLAGATVEQFAPLPVRATFRYKKRKGRREYVRATLHLVDGAAEVEKYPVEGAGVITSMTQTTGLVELSDDVTEVNPGDVVGYLPYEGLLD